MSSEVNANGRVEGNNNAQKDKESALSHFVSSGLRRLSADSSLYQPNTYKYKLRYKICENGEESNCFLEPQANSIYSVSGNILSIADRVTFNIYLLVEDVNGGELYDKYFRSCDEFEEFKCTKTCLSPGDYGYARVDAHFKLIRAIEVMNSIYLPDDDYRYRAPYDILDVDDTLTLCDDWVDGDLADLFGLWAD